MNSEQTVNKIKKYSEGQRKRYNFDYYQPILSLGDDIFRKTDKFLEIKCRTCGNWFEPKNGQLNERVRKLKQPEKNKGHSYLFCSDECKHNNNDYYKKFIRWKLSDETKSKMSKSKTGRIVSEECKIKLSVFNTGKKLTEECKQKIRDRNIGKILSEEHRKKISEGVRNHPPFFSDKTRQKMRLNIIRKIEQQRLNGQPLSPFVGKLEKSFLDELQRYTVYKIIWNDRSFRYIVGRFPDGHIPELNLFIQFDEQHHFKDKDCKIYHDDDNRCTLELASLGYLVYRVSEKDWKENKEYIIQNFLLLCNKGDL